MAIEWSEESQFKKEMRKWNTPKRDGGMNCNGFEKYPQMLYKAQKNPLSGKMEVAIAADVVSLDGTIVILSAEQFNASCQLLVNSDGELDKAKDGGWRESQAEAMAFLEALDLAVATAAAERNYSDRNLSEKAKAEATEIESKLPGHVAEIPRTKRRYTRKVKPQPAA